MVPPPPHAKGTEMDFTKKDYRGAAEVPQFCALKWPETGEAIIDDATGEAVGVMVLGATARSVQAALRADAQARVQGAKAKDTETRALEDIQADLVKSAARVTAGFVHVHRGDREATAADAEWFYDLNMFSTASLMTPKAGQWQNQSFAQQVLAFSNEVGFGLGNG